MEPISKPEPGNITCEESRFETEDHAADAYSNVISRRTAYDILRNDAATYWKQLPPQFQVDKELVLYVLKNSPNLPPKSDFERKFPQSLRFDRDYVLEFAERPDFRTLYEERRLFVPEHLKGDKDVMLAYCRKIPRSLQDCTEELTDDRDVVQAAVRLAGLELQYASMRLREDEEIVRLACQNHGCALEHCRPGGSTRMKLTSDRDFMFSVVLRSQEGGRMLQYAPESLRRDRELLLEAIAHGMQFRFCPIELQNSPDFLIAAVSRKSNLYLDFHRRDIQKIVEVAIAAVVAPDSTHAVHERAFAVCPEIRACRDVALAIATRGEKSFVREFLTGVISENEQNHSSTATNHNIHVPNAPDYLSDKEIMCQAIQRDSNMYSYCHRSLLNDKDILIAAMTAVTACDILRNVSAPLLVHCPEIAIKAIEVSNRIGLRSICHIVPDELWQNNRDVAIAWIRRGCRLIPQLDRLILSDRELALEVATHCWHEFGKVGVEFRSDVQFMTEAVDRCGCVLRFASPDIRNSMPLMVRAVANHAYALTLTSRNTISTQTLHSSEKDRLLLYINEKLALHEVFVVQFLRGIAITSPHVHPFNRSHLPMLDRGVETGQAFKKLIADFLGVPVGDDLKLIRNASVHLTNPPPLQLPPREDTDTRAHLNLDNIPGHHGIAQAPGADARHDHRRHMFIQRRRLRSLMLFHRRGGGEGNDRNNPENREQPRIQPENAIIDAHQQRLLFEERRMLIEDGFVEEEMVLEGLDDVDDDWDEFLFEG